MIVQFDVTVSGVVGVDGAEALQGGGSEGDARRSTDVLHLLHLTDASLEDTVRHGQQPTSQRVLKRMNPKMFRSDSQEDDGEQSSYNDHCHQHQREDC